MDSFFTNYLKVSLLNNFNSGNTGFDFIITLCLIGLISSFNLDKVIKFCNNLIYKNRNYELTLYCEEIKYSRGTRVKGSNTYKAMLIHIKNKISKNEVLGLKKIKEYYTTKEYDIYDMNLKDPILFMCNQNEPFRFIGDDEPNIMFNLTVNRSNTNDDDEKYSIKQYELKLIAGKGVNLKTLQEYVEKQHQKYMDFLELYDDKLYVFDFNGINQDNKVVFKQNIFQTTCKMTNLFFHNKKKILDKILFFEKNKDWYETQSKPYTLGICTYGPPGCGKTSFEKALAKMLKRHLIIVDLSKIKSKNQADAIFFSEKINDRKIPYDKRLYIFPDFDCQSDITNERTTDTIHEDKDEMKKDNVIIINQNKTQNLLEKLEKNEKDKMNLSKLLNILDGIPERTGQIMIFNTNHPEHLDKALLRPGRMDLIFKFDKINKENTIHMIENFYKQQISIDENKIPCKKFTPAELFNILCNYPNVNDAISNIDNWKINTNDLA